MSLTWPLIFGVMTFGLIICPAIVFAIHLNRLKKEDELV